MVLAKRSGGVLGLFIGAQACFWFVAFFCMPLYLLIAQPVLGLELADPRVSFPTYSSGIAPVLWICALGLAVYVLSLRLFAGLFRDKNPNEHDERLHRSLDALRPVALTLYLLGWVGRYGAVNGISSLDSAFSTFATVGSSLLIVSVREKKQRAVSPLIVVLILMEVLWAFSYTSKAALIVPLLALCMRWLLRQRSKSMRKRLVVIAALTCTGFLLLQPVKGVNTAEQVSARNSGNLAAAKGSLVSILERFDGFSAITDAYTIRPGGWLSPAEFGDRLVSAAVPKGPLQRPTASTGQHWTQEVRAQSTPEQKVTDVSLAAGGTAEGLAVMGIPGVIAENLVLALITLALCAGLQSGRPGLMLYSSNFIFSTTLYEQGLLGVAASANKSLQVLIIGFILLVLFTSLQKTLKPSVAKPPLLNRRITPLGPQFNVRDN